jgi:hypothetical protein
MPCDSADRLPGGRRYALVLLDLAEDNGCVAERGDPDESLIAPLA